MLVTIGGKLHQKQSALDGHGQVVLIQLNDLLHGRGVKHYAAVDRYGSSDKTCSGASNNHRDIALIGELHHRSDILGGEDLHKDLRNPECGPELIMIVVLID